jgi:hypothetical protein
MVEAEGDSEWFDAATEAAVQQAIASVEFG